MLLKQLTTSSDRKLAKINSYLKESFGFTLNSSVRLDTLEKMYDKLEKELYEMKLDNQTPKDSEYSKKLLMKEGIVTLLESSKNLILEDVIPVDQVKSKVVAWLCDYACKCMNIGDSIDDAVSDSMRHYRSSKYRFPDQTVEELLRSEIQNKMGITRPPATLYDSMYEEADTDSDDISELSNTANRIEDELRNIKDRNLERREAIHLGDPTDPKSINIFNKLPENDKSRYVALWDLRKKVSDTMNKYHRARQKYAEPQQPTPVYPSAKPGTRYMGDSVEEGLRDFFKQGDKYVPQVGDSVQHKKNHLQE